MTEKEIGELYTSLVFQYESAIDILLTKRLIGTELATAAKENYIIQWMKKTSVI